LARIIQEHVEKPLAEELLFGKLAKGGVVRVKRDGDKLAFAYIEAPVKLPSKDADEQPEQELVDQ
jgi:ATP-dependent Clp protease ATP-binding subunit ClpA